MSPPVYPLLVLASVGCMVPLVMGNHWDYYGISFFFTALIALPPPLSRPPMGVHSWWGYNMPMIVALLDQSIIGKPPVINVKPREGCRFAKIPV
jgi:hypothetical protein